MPLRLDLLRHGRSEASHPDGDRSRRLTPEGAAAIRTLGERLGREAWRPELVLTSPYRRAVETAELLLRSAAAAAAAEPFADLEPDADAGTVALSLEARLDGVRHALVVGHQPLLGRLAELWSGTPCGLQPGEMLQLELEALGGIGAGRIVQRLID